MKNIALSALLTLCPAALRAQEPALDQLNALPSVQAAAAAVAEVPAVSPDNGALILPARRTGGTHAVVAAGGGFIYAAPGKFQPAVFNGSGYLLPPGQYMPAAGGLRAKPDGLTGKWIGQGEWTYQGSGAHCYMNLEFEDRKDYLLRKGGYFDCGFVGLASEPARFEKRGTQLFDQAGQAAGSYEGNVITLNEAYSDSVGIVTTIKADGLHFDYSEIWTEKNGRELYVITGRLFSGG